MLRGWIWNIYREQSVRGSTDYLLVGLDRLQRGIAIRKVAGQASPNRRKNRHQSSSRELRRRSGDGQWRSDREPCDTGQGVEDGGSRDRLSAQARPPQQRSLG